ncbi:MAG TPA: fumarylacetoacetase [Povalibacter sp.]|uniref:fumarylacetoacetase n=1 Tax=Povalibacter sp. TaxID=1962978 RepID=UPI002CD50D8A|nr:fumarylacetoacetase [Povalibacter sp.]HMN46468.1 fumarylacetoacetase [Povalibacter sp.]
MHPPLDETHAPDAASWVASAARHPDFPVQNLPLGSFSQPGDTRRHAGIAIGDHILSLSHIASLLEGDARRAVDACGSGTLNGLLALGAAPRRALRRAVFRLLTDRNQAHAVQPALFAANDCTLHVPAEVGDYTDFYTGIHHATNVGKLFRPDHPLLPNYKYVPIGYHGRSSSIVASGTPVIRPRAQIKAADAPPVYQPTQRLDYELEMGVWIAGSNERGEPIPIARAGEHVAGLCLLNDWSARDVQTWEYQPLGPFLAKNFLTTVSPWIVTREALAPYRMAQPSRPEGDPAPLPYLLDSADQAAGAYAIVMEVHLQTSRMRDAGIAPHRLSRGPMSVMYWTVAQLIAHHTCNGCNLRPGDLLGTGTLSGVDPSSFGSLIELSGGGRHPLQLPGGETRTFLQEGDRLVMTAHAEAPGRVRIGFGECAGEVVASS